MIWNHVNPFSIIPHELSLIAELFTTNSKIVII
ncbi:MAG: hypothetical protein ACI828_002559, partial [Flavobacteriales bacterium]